MIYPKLHVDIAWMNRVSGTLDRFRKIKRDTYNCRCLICGDSKKDKRKARFFFYVKKGNLNVVCHNCGYSKSFYNFMKEAFPVRFTEYKRETLFDSFNKNTAYSTSSPTLTREETVEVLVPPVGISFTEFKQQYQRLDALEDSHLAKQMMLERAFGVRELSRLYYSENFKELAQKLDASLDIDKMKAEPRVVIPFVNKEGIVEMVQGRSIGDSKIKYLSIKAHDNVQKIYGMYELDAKKPVYCVEGPLDSLFVDNCIATCDANLTRADADVYVWDAQPRNEDVIRYMTEAIDSGKSVVIWPMSPNKKLDINDMIKGGISRDNLMKLIKKNTFSGLKAKVKLMQWKRL